LLGKKASTIFDLVVERGGEREIFDAKFLYKSGGCDKWGDQQLRDARKLSTRGKPMTITPKGCDCPSLKKSKELQNRAGAQRKTIMTIEKSVR
jgi:hypothetical protein